MFAVVVGVLSTSFTTENLPANIREELEKLGGASLVTPAGALGFYFLLFVFAFSLFACSQMAAARREEADQQLETLLALSVGRTRWLGGRIALGAAGIAALALVAGLLSWAGAASQGADVSLGEMLEAGLNCLPTSLLFLALASLAYGLMPRASTGIAYGLVSVAFVWQLFGSLHRGSPVDRRPQPLPARRARSGTTVPPHCGDRDGRARRRWCVREHVGVQAPRSDSCVARHAAPGR